MATIIGPMTFLQLCQRLQSESGTSGALQATTANASGEWGRIVNWIADAYVKIQNKRPDWLWMERDVQFDTIAGQQLYSTLTSTFTTPAGTGIPDFGEWKLSSASGDCSFRLWLKSVGVLNETFLSANLNYDEFRDFYIFGAKRNTVTRPISICVNPAKNLMLGFTPNDVYTVVGRYFQAPTLLTLDADVPAMPARYHLLIVWLALEAYGLHESAPDAIAKAHANGKPLSNALEQQQLEEIEYPDPLVS